jgi:CheY-like chemotaxis protein
MTYKNYYPELRNKNYKAMVMEDRKKILIVDDEPSVRLLINTYLKDDYTVLEAQNGIEAREIVFNQKPNLILMDIKMPQMDGISACNIIKSNDVTRSIPMVMISGLDYEFHKELSLERGADAYIAKPFNKQELLDVCSNLL